MKKYQNDLASMLRSFKSKNPKTYWDYINTKKKSTKNEKQPSCEEFADMFKNLGSNANDQDNDESLPVNFFNYIDVHMYLRDYSALDNLITYNEVKDTINNLK